MRYFLLLTLFALGACGVKPTFVEPPAGVENDTFPRTYPAPETINEH